MEKWRDYHGTVRRLSVLFGFILIFGLSQDGYVVSFIVALSLLTLTSAEARILRKVKELNNVNQCPGVLWVLLTGCLAYLAVDKLWIRVVILCLVVLCHYIYLYAICCSEKMTVSCIKKLLWDIPILLLVFPLDMFEKENILEKKIKRQSRVVGVCILLIVLMCVLFPLYIMADVRMYSILAALIAGAASEVPALGICVFLGILPAMANYSIIKGLSLDIKLGNQEGQTIGNIAERNYFINASTIKIVTAGLTIVNTVFVILQIEQLIRCCITPGTERLLGDMRRIFPILVCIGLNLIFVFINNWITGFDKTKNRLLILAFILSVLGNIALLLTGYIVKIANFGVNASDLTGVSITVMYMVLIFVGWSCLVLRRDEFICRIVIWGVLLLSVFQIMPTEYFVSHINVIVFMNKYEHGLIGECVGQKDIDLRFLCNMGLDAVQAMTNLLDNEILYEGTEMSLGEVTENYILKMFYTDLSLEDRESIESASDERLEVLLDILEQKTEYKVIGKRNFVYKALRDVVWPD